jgi:hypothetical protein
MYSTCKCAFNGRRRRVCVCVYVYVCVFLSMCVHVRGMNYKKCLSVKMHVAAV